MFQGTYKAVLVKTDEQLLYLSAYIHLNPSYKGLSLDYPYSSLSAYLGKGKIKWLKPKGILDYFAKTNKADSYKKYLLSWKKEALFDNLILE